jgi:hypothetical protein
MFKKLWEESREMSRLIRIIVCSLVTLALAAPAFAYNVVNTSWTVHCVFSSSTCSVSPTDYVSTFAVSGGRGNGRLQSRVFQAQASSVESIYFFGLVSDQAPRSAVDVGCISTAAGCR